MSDVKWRGFERPHRLIVDEKTKTQTFASFVARPFNRGFGVTISNSLRRILLSSIPGAAVTAVRIQNGTVTHDLDVLPCIYEDVIELILNIKLVCLSLDTNKAERGTLVVEKAGPITAGMIKLSSNAEVANKDLVLCKLVEDTKLEIEFEIRPGRGYVMASEQDEENYPVGFIPIDANYSPIKKVNCSVDNIRVGYKTDYESLRFDITTDGTIDPEEALAYAARVQRELLNVFVYFEDSSVEEQEVAQEDTRFSELLDQKVDETEFTVRAYNCLQAAGINTMRELVIKTEADMLKYKNFGRKSLNEIKTILESMGLRFGMKPYELPPSRNKKKD